MQLQRLTCPSIVERCHVTQVRNVRFPPKADIPTGFQAQKKGRAPRGARPLVLAL